MTAQEIINYANLQYTNTQTDANKVVYLNKIHNELYMELGRLTNEPTLDSSDVTVADQAEYDLPTGVKIEDVVRIEVETSETSSEYDEYIYAGIDDKIKNKKVFKRGSTNAKYYLYDDEEAISYADATIKVWYWPRPTAISSGDLSVTPTLDTLYHPLLCYALIVELANEGDNPDTNTADYYQQKYDEFLKKVKSNLTTNQNTRGNGRKEQREWW